jgi:Flp pilus assembly secretin CpaC
LNSFDIVNALPMSDRAPYIQDKKIGTTNVSVFDQSMKLIGVLGEASSIMRQIASAQLRVLCGATAPSLGSMPAILADD